MHCAAKGRDILFRDLPDNDAPRQWRSAADMLCRRGVTIGSLQSGGASAPSLQPSCCCVSVYCSFFFKRRQKDLLDVLLASRCRPWLTFETDHPASPPTCPSPRDAGRFARLLGASVAEDATAWAAWSSVRLHFWDFVCKAAKLFPRKVQYNSTDALVAARERQESSPNTIT